MIYWWDYFIRGNSSKWNCFNVANTFNSSSYSRSRILPRPVGGKCHVPCAAAIKSVIEILLSSSAFNCFSTGNYWLSCAHLLPTYFLIDRAKQTGCRDIVMLTTDKRQSIGRCTQDLNLAYRTYSRKVRWNTALWLDCQSHVTSFNQSECLFKQIIVMQLENLILLAKAVSIL